MLFSILIPVYNTSVYLQDCVNSILKQSVQDFEIILCDDCSVDNSFEICKKMCRDNPQKIKVIHNNENMGLLLTRRKLFKEAKGEWIFCVDSDDVINPSALERISAIINHEQPDMVLFNLKCFHINGKTEEFKPNLIPNYTYAGSERKKVYAEIYANKYLNSLCTKIYRRELIDLCEDYTPFKGLRMGEDLFQSYPLFDQAGKIFYLNESLYLYRKNEVGMTAKVHKGFYNMRKMLWQRENYYLEKWNLGSIRNKAMLRRIKDIIWFLVEIHQIYGKNTYQIYVDQVNKEGLLKEYRKSVHKQELGCRTAIISFLVTHRCDLLFAFYLWVEKYILRLS